nr:SRPBCC family protein [Mycolicibacterium baixiangningiae]
MRADPQTVWDVLADFGSIRDWLPGIDHSCLLSTLAARLLCLGMAKSSDTMLAGLAARWETAHV